MVAANNYMLMNSKSLTVITASLHAFLIIQLYCSHFSKGTYQTY